MSLIATRVSSLGVAAVGLAVGLAVGPAVACSSAPAPAAEKAPAPSAPRAPAPAPPPAAPPVNVTSAGPVQKTEPAAPTAGRADVVVRDISPGATIAIRVGQTLGITNTDAAASWQVDYPADAMKMLTPADKVDKPGTAGWVWRAISAGTVEIALTSRPPCPVRPCELNPMRYTLTIEIKRP